MKSKTVKILSIIIALILSFDIGFYLSRYTSDKSKIIDDAKMLVGANAEDVKDTRSTEKTKEVLLKVYHIECGHLTWEKVKDEEIKNMSKEDLIEKYKEYTLILNQDNLLSFYKEDPYLCENHFTVKEYEDKIVVFYRNSGAIKSVLDVNISMLSEEDKNLFKNGVDIDSKEELTHLIEDYTS